MLYDVSLRLVHKYEAPAGNARHMLRLMPSEIAGEQRLIAGNLDVSPKPDEWLSLNDFFGNGAREIAYRSAHEEVSFVMRARVERLLQPERLDVSPKLADVPQILKAHKNIDPQSPHHFVGPSARVPFSADIQAFAVAQIPPGTSVLETVRALGMAVNAHMQFDSDATEVDTAPLDAFIGRRGVCQDFSHIMIAGLRAVGVPAGYVSGFLRTIPPAGAVRLEGADAMHAWVRAWCGDDMGWVEFDPTNAIFVSTDHIVIARGRDYGDVAPVRGVLRMSGAQSADHAVDVVPVLT